MPALSTKDAEQLLRLVADAESIGGDQPFTPELLAELGLLIAADSVAYNELDRVRRRNLVYVERAPDDEEDDSGIDPDTFWDIVIEEHPVCLAQQRGRFDALKLSDFVSRRELRGMRVYDIWLRPFGVEHELSVALPSPLWHTKTLMFNRNGGRDFTERDRLLLDLLQPHLTRLWRAARTRRLLRAALAELEHARESESSGVVLLSVAGDVEFASPPARRLLDDFFGVEAGAMLPSVIAGWLERGSEPLVHRRNGRELTVERAEHALHLRERQVEADLTARELEVLAWVARGKTNAQIAELLWLAPSTVRKHLENVYAKLGVNTRTAAAARFLGILDAESS